MLLSDSRTVRVLVVSVAGWLLMGWLWGDDWWWTVLRALGGTMAVVGIVALYTSNRPATRVSRIALGALVGGWCAYAIGGNSGVVVATATVLAGLLIGGEYLNERDLRRRTTSD